METWVSAIWAIECLDHGDQLLTDGMSVPEVRAWIESHQAGLECMLKTHLDESMTLVLTEVA